MSLRGAMFLRGLLSRRAASVAAAAAGTTLALCESPFALSASSQLGQSEDGIELRYFDGKGLAEKARILMALSGVPYTDTRWKMDMSQPYGQRCPSFMAARESGELAPALDRAPILIVDGVTFGQSRSIERYLARRVGLYGENELESACIDAFTEHLRDLVDLAQKATDSEEFKAQTLPRWFEKLEKVAGETRGCIVGKSLSLADVSLYYLVCEYFPARDAYIRGPGAKPAQAAEDPSVTMLSGCPKLAASVEAVRSHPAVAKHVAGRQYTAPW